jgi:hypothetical protein
LEKRFTVPPDTKVGAVPAEGDESPARTVLAAGATQAAVRVPEVVTGEPDTVNSAGRLRPTLVTEPDPPVYCGMFSVPLLKVAAPLVPVVVSVIGAW